MFTKAEETRMRRDRIVDALCDRDDFEDANQSEFLEWSDKHYADYYDASTVDGAWEEYFAIDDMFDSWLKQQRKVSRQ